MSSLIQSDLKSQPTKSSTPFDGSLIKNSQLPNLRPWTTPKAEDGSNESLGPTLLEFLKDSSIAISNSSQFQILDGISPKPMPLIPPDLTKNSIPLLNSIQTLKGIPSSQPLPFDLPLKNNSASENITSTENSTCTVPSERIPPTEIISSSLNCIPIEKIPSSEKEKYHPIDPIDERLPMNGIFSAENGTLSENFTLTENSNLTYKITLVQKIPFVPKCNLSENIAETEVEIPNPDSYADSFFDSTIEPINGSLTSDSKLNSSTAFGGLDSSSSSTSTIKAYGWIESPSDRNSLKVHSQLNPTVNPPDPFKISLITNPSPFSLHESATSIRDLKDPKVPIRITSNDLKPDHITSILANSNVNGPHNSILQFISDSTHLEREPLNNKHATFERPPIFPTHGTHSLVHFVNQPAVVLNQPPSIESIKSDSPFPSIVLPEKNVITLYSSQEKLNGSSLDDVYDTLWGRDSGSPNSFKSRNPLNSNSIEHPYSAESFPGCLENSISMLNSTAPSHPPKSLASKKVELPLSRNSLKLSENPLWKMFRGSNDALNHLTQHGFDSAHGEELIKVPSAQTNSDWNLSTSEGGLSRNLSQNVSSHPSISTSPRLLSRDSEQRSGTMSSSFTESPTSTASQSNSRAVQEHQSLIYKLLHHYYHNHPQSSESPDHGSESISDQGNHGMDTLKLPHSSESKGLGAAQSFIYKLVRPPPSTSNSDIESHLSSGSPIPSISVSPKLNFSESPIQQDLDKCNPSSLDPLETTPRLQPLKEPIHQPPHLTGKKQIPISSLTVPHMNEGFLQKLLHYYRHHSDTPHVELTDSNTLTSHGSPLIGSMLSKSPTSSDELTSVSVSISNSPPVIRQTDPASHHEHDIFRLLTLRKKKHISIPFSDRPQSAPVQSLSSETNSLLKPDGIVGSGGGSGGGGGGFLEPIGSSTLIGGSANPSMSFGSPTNGSGKHFLGVVGEENRHEDSFRDKYGKVDEFLGKGANAEVRLAHIKGMDDVGFEKLYAIKTFRKRKSDESTKEYTKKVISEFCISSSLHHENIIETIDLIKNEKDQWCQVMEFMSGGDLYARVKDGNLLDPNEINCYFKQLLEGVAYMHGVGVAHRDLKPENLLLDKSGRILKITDFGTSEVFRTVWEKVPRKVKGLAGSDPYIAPEEWENENEYDPTKVDIWACGIIYYVLSFQSIPWRIAKKSDTHYAQFLRIRKSGSFTLDKLCLSIRNLMYQILEPDPAIRLTSTAIQEDSWFKGISSCRVDTLCSWDSEDDYQGEIGVRLGAGHIHHVGSAAMGSSLTMKKKGGKGKDSSKSSSSGGGHTNPTTPIVVTPPRSAPLGSPYGSLATDLSHQLKNDNTILRDVESGIQNPHNENCH